MSDTEPPRCACGKPAVRDRLRWADRHKTPLCPECFVKRRGIELEPTPMERHVDAAIADETLTNLLKIEKELRD